MSSSRVMYQGLQSCLEQNSGDARVLKLKLALPKSNLLTGSVDSAASASPVHQEPSHECEKNLNMGGWSFLQSLSQPKESAAETQKVYVHPLTKRSASSLSKQSLEMCTESLGSETGSAGGSDIDSLSLDNENENGGFLIDQPPSRSYTSRKKMSSHNVSFPPPLTSMSSSNGVHMRPFREGGRLILKAVPSPSVNSYFHAERGDGRLRLSMVNPMPPTDNEAEPDEEKERETFVFEEDADDDEEEEEEEEGESFGFEEEVEESFAFEEEDDESFVFEEAEEDKEGEMEFGMEKFNSRDGRRGGRCNEVRLPQLGWEPCWVAT